MNTISVYTQKDMNDLYAILSRNGYAATAYNIVSTTENTCCGKQWRIDYYDPKDVITNAYSEENILPKKSEKMKRFLFYCNNCGFEYSGPDAEPCSCSLCGTVNDCCYVEEIE